MENLYTPDCIRTYSGHYLNVFEPDPAKIDIHDIAHALAHQCRFAGHTKRHYSVAQHSVWVSRCVLAPENELAALLHDASEAYLCDIPKPIKLRMPDYNKIEATLMEAIAAKFGFKWPLDPEVVQYDKVALEYEWENIVLKDELMCWDMAKSHRIFMKQYERCKHSKIY